MNAAFGWPGPKKKVTEAKGERRRQSGEGRVVRTPIEQIEEALDIPIPSSEDLVLDSARRLTGPGLLWHRPGAILDVFTQCFSGNKIEALWREHGRQVLDALGWETEHLTARQFEGGLNLALSAPMDQLYSAIFAAQTAWHFCAAELLHVNPGNFKRMIADVRGVMEEEANPELIQLLKAAHTHGTEMLCDDDDISIGHGIGSQVWACADLPKPDAVPWARLHDIPIALITGTNGKTTTTRLACAIGAAAGKISGLTSTDMVAVGEDVLDRGDYSGPGGARMLLRDPRVELAFLEVARGGILRRGLPLHAARAAVVTNVAADHLGQYGVNTVEHLAKAKFAVHRALAHDGVLILNADDALVRAEAAQTRANIWWFSLNANTPQIQQAKSQHKPCAYLQGRTLCFFDGDRQTEIVDVSEVPLTMDGAARYNILNALAALSLARAMHIDFAAIRTALRAFHSDPKDNPGRCNEFSVKGARVFVDFAHNPHSIAALVSALANLPAKRRFIMLSHGGDRSDQDIQDLTAGAMELRPDMVMATELPDYLRGRELGEVPALIETEALRLGLRNDQILHADSPLDATRKILAKLCPGDLALLLVLSDRDDIFELLSSKN
jgi:UDP-N-acetylmuramyl tripeptide synthase